MKRKETPLKKMNQTQSREPMYDALLEEFLPAIHKAAHAVQPNEMPAGLLLAGLKGLKEAFLCFSGEERPIEHHAFAQNIHCFMLAQIKTTRPIRAC